MTTPIDAMTVPRRRKRLTDIDLVEISVVDQPANRGARQLLFKHVDDGAEAATIEAATQAAVDAVVERIVARGLERIASAGEAHAARLTADLTRIVGAPAAKAAPVAPAPAASILAEALALVEAGQAARDAAARAAPPPARFWREALRQLGENLEPDLPPSGQMNAALRSDAGRRLMAASSDDARLLSPGG